MNENVLSSYCVSITDGTHSTVQDDNHGSCFLLSSKNVKSGNVTFDSNDRRISSETLDKLRDRTKTELGDVLLTTVGSIGEVALVRGLNYEFQRSVAIIKTNRAKLLPEYLYFLLRTNRYQSIINNLVSGSVQKCLFLDSIKQIPISVPELSTQQSILKVLIPLEKQISCLESINDNLGGVCFAS